VTLAIDPRLARLQEALRRGGPTLVAFSGGVDSTFLLAIALDVLGADCHAVTAVSATMAQSEVADARALGAELGLGPRHHLVDSHELSRPGFAANPVDRCAMCKTELMEHAAPLAARLGLPTVALGTNLDDLGDVRPGIAAARDHGATMPMVEAGLTKADVRELSRARGLRTWDKPQLACLSSRFPYGTAITPARLRQVDEFEDGLRALGFRECRVRYHDTVARLELAGAELARAVTDPARLAIIALGKRCGFTYVALDLAGFRSGSANEVLVPLGRKAAP
jgi:uncharacterized protein